MKHQQLDDWSVPRMHWAFPRITATEIRWRRKVVERGSCVVDVRRRPISDIKRTIYLLLLNISDDAPQVDV